MPECKCFRTKGTSVVLGATLPNKELSVHTRTSILEYDMDALITWIEFIVCYYLLNYLIEVFTWCHDPPLSLQVCV